MKILDSIENEALVELLTADGVGIVPTDTVYGVVLLWLKILKPFHVYVT